MPDGQLHLFLTPTERAEELVELDLAYGLKAEPFRTDVAGISMLQGVHADAAFGFRLARLHRLGDDVQTLLLNHPRPVLVYLLTDNVAVGAHLVFPKLPFTLMLVLVGQPPGYVANLFRLQPMDEADVQKDASADVTACIAVGLLKTVVFLILTCFGIVSYLGGEVHAAKISIKFHSAVFYIEVLAKSRG